MCLLLHGTVAFSLGGISTWAMPLLMEETQIGAVGMTAVSLEDIIGEKDVGNLVFLNVGNDILGEIA